MTVTLNVPTLLGGEGSRSTANTDNEMLRYAQHDRPRFLLISLAAPATRNSG